MDNYKELADAAVKLIKQYEELLGYKNQIILELRETIAVLQKEE